MASLFTRIITWEIPSYKLYEDEYTYVFLDIFPQVPGHTLIVPKIEVDHFSEVPEPYYSAIFQTAKKLSPAIKKATGCNRVCAAFLGYQIQHCHYQLLPTMSEEDFRWRTMPQADSQDLKELQEKILSHLENR
jgi:histidine triad (HIT) family protein